MLSLAAECIGAGVPLKELVFNETATFTERIEDQEFEPDERELDAFYRPLAARLRGVQLISMHFCTLERASLDVLNKVVLHAPDMRAAYYQSQGWSIDDAWDTIECSGLQILYLSFDYDDAGPIFFHFELQNVQALTECTLRVGSDFVVDDLFGGRIWLRMLVPAGADLVAQVSDVYLVM